MYCISKSTLYLNFSKTATHVDYTYFHSCCRGVQEGAILIDSSTIDPSVSQEMMKLASDAKASYMDAPVSGGMDCEGKTVAGSFFFFLFGLRKY